MELFGTNLPPGLVYVEPWLAEDLHDEVVRVIDTHKYSESLSRRTQHYGYYYDYSAAEVELTKPAPAAPDLLLGLARRLCREGYFHRVPDQIIVNEYVAGQGISAHVDRLSFGPVVATVSLLESWPMMFRRDGHDPIEVQLSKGSVALMTGESRTTWTHEIMKRKSDMVGGLRVPRGRRLSVTFRTVNATE
jgi:alkylated DNA repair dioxygenase AlkB